MFDRFRIVLYFWQLSPKNSWKQFNAQKLPPWNFKNLPKIIDLAFFPAWFWVIPKFAKVIFFFYNPITLASKFNFCNFQELAEERTLSAFTDISQFFFCTFNFSLKLQLTVGGVPPPRKINSTQTHNLLIGGWSINRRSAWWSVSCSVGRMVSRSEGQSIGRSSGRSLSLSIGRMVGQVVGRVVAWLIGMSV